MNLRRADIPPFLAGALFGAGLLVSGMFNPAKVLAFLDVAGTWDPSLAFVMAFGVMTAFIGYRWAIRRPAPFAGAQFYFPEAREIDARLLGGAALFGIGWGLTGLCPGPALLALSAFRPEPFLFVAAMIAGMKLESLLRRL